MAFSLALASAHRLAYRVCLHSIHDAIGIRNRQSDHREIIQIWGESIYAVGMTRCMPPPCAPLSKNAGNPSLHLQ